MSWTQLDTFFRGEVLTHVAKHQACWTTGNTVKKGGKMNKMSTAAYLCLNSSQDRRGRPLHLRHIRQVQCCMQYSCPRRTIRVNMQHEHPCMLLSGFLAMAALLIQGQDAGDCEGRIEDWGCLWHLRLDMMGKAALDINPLHWSQVEVGHNGGCYSLKYKPREAMDAHDLFRPISRFSFHTTTSCLFH